MKKRSTRRRFLAQAAGSFLVLRNAGSAKAAPSNNKLNIALVGVGGRGRWFVGSIPRLKENVVAMCDVNDRRAAESFAKIPRAKKFHDFRRMLEELDKEIDAVIVATPDHTHAVITATALRHGKHVYCEKPLTHTVAEARTIRMRAAESRTATQMGNQGTASPAYRRAVEIVREGVLGKIEEVHVWNTGGGPGLRPFPEGSVPVPDYLKWDLWLGPAAERPFHPRWLRWHGWRDFGTGKLGNWASHTMNLPFRALGIDSLWKTPGARIKVTARVSRIGRFSFPRWEIIRYDIPARGTLPPVRLTWYNGPGGRAPEARKIIEKLLGRRLDWGDAGEKRWRDHVGCLLVGSEGKLHANAHNTEFSLIPEEKFKGQGGRPRSLPRSPGHEKEWIEDAKGGPRAMSHFGYAGLLTEFVLLGNVATLFDRTLVYDPRAGKIVGDADADRVLRSEYRKGWVL